MPENKDDIDLGTWTLDRAAQENRVDIASALIARGDDVNARDEESSISSPKFCRPIPSSRHLSNQRM